MKTKHALHIDVELMKQLQAEAERRGVSSSEAISEFVYRGLNKIPHDEVLLSQKFLRKFKNTTLIDRAKPYGMFAPLSRLFPDSVVSPINHKIDHMD